jgi:flagellar hook-associated protein 2
MTTTSSATSSATSALVASLGAGSGVDMSALANNLAVAQFAGKTDRLTTQSDTLDKQISAASTLKSMLATLSSSLGDRVRTGDLSPQPLVANTSIASGTLSGTTRPTGSYSLEVTHLASTQTLASPAFGAGTSTVGSGTLTIRFGTVGAGSFAEDTAHAAVDIAIPAGATLAETASAINLANTGITAYVANTADGAKLVFKGQEGAANGFIVTAAEDPADPGLAALAWEPTTGAPAQLLAGSSDAVFKIDGLPMTSKSNSVTEAVPGLNLKLTGTNRGSPTNITFADTSSAITTTMQDLVGVLNEVAGELATVTNPKTGDLARDGGARTLQRTLSALGTTVIMPNAPAGAPSTFGDLGISVQRDGTFTLDTVRLAATLKANPQAAGAMFTNGLYGVYGTIDGIVRKANTASDPGSIAGSIARYTSQKTTNTASKSTLAGQQETLRTTMVARFAKADSRIGASKSTLSFLQNQIAAWNKSGN